MTQQYNDAQLTSYVDQLFKRLERIETQLRLVSEKVGIPMEVPANDLPEDVVELARAGDRLGAIKRLRELTQLTAEEAREAVAEI
jgi:hypothetical protein